MFPSDEPIGLRNACVFFERSESPRTGHHSLKSSLQDRIIDQVLFDKFTDWDSTVVALTGDAVYTACFETNEHYYFDIVTAPNCTESGYTTHTCETCGYSYVDSETDAAGHTAGAWIIDEDAEVEKSGRRHKECTTCGRGIEKEEIPVLPSELSEKPNEGCLAR